MELEWTDMARRQQQLQKIMRALLPPRRSVLTTSECELLALLYLRPEQNTPVMLSQGSGMKKEAVSRCLKALYEKDCIRKERQPDDERSYRLFITETGLAELKKGYESILQPFYDLWRSAGEDFEAFVQCADRLAAQIAVETVRAYRQEQTNPMEVIFNVFRDQDHAIYRQLLG